MNTKFVILLAGVLFVLFVGVAGLAMYAKMRSGDRLVQQGDAAIAAGDYELAAKKYSRAVNRDQSRGDWLEKWRDALLQTSPDNPAVYQKAYKEHYMGILNKLASLNPTDPEAQIEFVDEFDHYVRRLGSGSLAGLQQITTLVEERSAQLDPEDPRTKELMAYRGRAVVDQMLRVSVEEDKENQAREDLVAAIQANPDDIESAISLAQWYYAQVGKALRDVRPTDTAQREFDQQLAKLLEEHGSAPEVAMFAFQVKGAEASRTVATPADRREMQESLAPAAKATLDTIASADPATLDPALLSTAARILPSYLDDDQRGALLELIQRASTARADDPDVLLLLGQALAVRQRFADAYDVFERVVQLPDEPVSLQGMILPEYRRIAVQDQVDMLLAQYELSADEAEKEKFLEEAKARRDVLETMTDVNSEDELRLRDAQIALIVGDNKQAIVLLEEIRRNLPDESPRVQRLLAQAQIRQRNLGEAARQYERLVASGQANAVDLAFLGDTYVQLGETDKALDAYERSLRQNPSYEVAKQRINAIKQATNVEGGLIDPVIAALMTAQKLSNEGDSEGAIKVLADAQAEKPDDFRLIRELAARYVAADRRPEAIEMVGAALERRPDNVDLKMLNQQVTIEDPVKAGEVIIDSLDNLTPLQKAIQRFYLYQGNGEMEKAKAAFADAERIDPNDPAVIEIGFLLAVARGSDGLEDASRYAARAAEQNADRIGGLTYKGRLELARGDTRAAEETFQRAVDRMAVDPISWRWLGQAQSRNGKVDAAMASFERAYQGRPTHVGIAEDYARALVAGGQTQKALEVASRAVAESGRTPSLINLWLDLEAQVGDRERAIENRRKLFDSDPSDVTNSLAYLNLLIQDKKFDAFESAVGVLESSGAYTPLQIANLRARALAEDGKPGEGRALLTSYIESLPEDEVAVESWMSLGRYEREFGTLDASIAAYEKARPYQSDKLREADRALGDLHFSAAQALGAQAATDPSGERSKEMREHLQAAVSAYTGVHAAEPSDAAVSKRLAETYIRLDRYQDARQALNAVGDDDDLQVLLLRSMIAQAGGDVRGAREFMDKAVALYPNDPVPYFRRADLNKSDEALFPDVIADLNQATKLRPGFVDAWTLRFQLYRAKDQMDEAFAQLSGAIDANPENNDLKRLLIGNLILYNRADRARAEVQKIADANWDNEAWIEQAAVISYRQRKYDEAKRYYARLYELNPAPLAAADLLNAWFRANDKPPRPEVNRLLRKVREGDKRKMDPREQIVTLMLEARAEHWLGETAAADKLTIESYKKADETSPIALRIWFEDVVERYHTADSAGNNEAFAFLDAHKQELGELKPIIKMLVIRNDMQSGASLDDCAKRLEALAGQLEDDPYNILEFSRLQNQVYYAQGRYEECAEACRTGLAVPGAESDLELNNNLAYVLAKHLKKPEEALPYAEAAADAAPLNAAVLDTLGWVYFESGRFRDADRVLQRAITTATGPDELVPAYLHLAQTKQATGDLSEARKYIRMAKQEAAKGSQTIKDQYGTDIDTLFAELNP